MFQNKKVGTLRRRSRYGKVSPAFSKAAGFQRAEPFGRAPQSAKSLSFKTVKGVRNAKAFRGGADTTAPPFAIRGIVALENSPVDCFQRTILCLDFQVYYRFAPSKTSHCDVFEIYLVANRNKEGRSCSPLLVALAKRGFGVAVSHLLLRFGGYALCSSRLSVEAQEGISPPAGGDQRAPPSGLLRAGLSSTSFSRRLRRRSAPTVTLLNQNLLAKLKGTATRSTL